MTNFGDSLFVLDELEVSFIMIFYLVWATQDNSFKKSKLRDIIIT